MIRTIQRDFIPAVGEHFQLLRGANGEWWQRLVSSVQPNYRGGSTQGYYILGADGHGYLWDNYPPRLRTFLATGVERYRQNPAAAIVTAAEIRRDAPPPPPPGTSVVRLFTRIRPLPANAGPMNALLGRDYMWVLAEEVKAIAAGPKSGDFPLPEALVARLVAFHMVDNVRGQVWPWRPQEITKARFTARFVSEEGTQRTYKLHGDFAKRDSHPPAWNDRGHEGTFEGELTIDMQSNKIVRFRARADCTAWSDATYDRNSPPPTGRYTVICALVEANDKLAQEVTPEQAGTGEYYLHSRLPVR
jgi:hypothetical protein